MERGGRIFSRKRKKGFFSWEKKVGKAPETNRRERGRKGKSQRTKKFPAGGEERKCCTSLNEDGKKGVFGFTVAKQGKRVLEREEGGRKTRKLHGRPLAVGGERGVREAYRGRGLTSRYRGKRGEGEKGVLHLPFEGKDWGILLGKKKKRPLLRGEKLLS